MITRLLLMAIIALCTTHCGREPSRLLRQGQLPIYDFPLYLTEGITGRLWKIDQDRTQTLMIDGLNDPRGVATDRFGNIYVAEYGAGRVLKLRDDDTSYSILAENLSEPSVLAVDSFGEVYVAQDGPRTISRISDSKVFGTYSEVPTALGFGVNDIPIVGLYAANKVMWGWDEYSSTATDIDAPVNVSLDGTGRVYVAQGDPLAGQVIRYHQRKPSGPTVVADSLVGPAGIAVDLTGNIFLVEQGAQRVVLVTFDGQLYSWITDVQDPQYLAFTQY